MGNFIKLNTQADISRLVRELCERTGLTQDKLAAKLGVTRPTINRWENGGAIPWPLALKQVKSLLWGLGYRRKNLLQGFFTN
jgi:transcriptional regulator with XRE-family HTH domain